MRNLQLLAFIFAASHVTSLVPADGPEIIAVTASSELKSEDDRYSALSAFEGGSEYSWVEGKDGDGIGECLTVEFKAVSTIRQIEILNGFGDPRYWSRNNRVKELSIENEKGPVKTIELPDHTAKQRIELQGFAGKLLILRIKSVYKSNKDPDTAIAEINIPGATFSPALDKRRLNFPILGFYTAHKSSPASERFFLILDEDGKCQIAAIQGNNHPEGGAQSMDTRECDFTVQGNQITLIYDGGRVTAGLKRAGSALVVESDIFGIQHKPQWYRGSQKGLRFTRKLRHNNLNAAREQIREAVQRNFDSQTPPCSGVNQPADSLCL